MSRILSIGVAVGFLLSLLVIVPAVAEPDGAALLEERCSVCHPSSRPKSKQKTVAEWETTVTRMMGKGARLSETEKKVLVDYLGATYKP